VTNKKGHNKQTFNSTHRKRFEKLRQTIIQPSDGVFQLNFATFSEKNAQVMISSPTNAQTLSSLRKAITKSAKFSGIALQLCWET